MEWKVSVFPEKNGNGEKPTFRFVGSRHRAKPTFKSRLSCSCLTLLHGSNPHGRSTCHPLAELRQGRVGHGLPMTRAKKRVYMALYPAGQPTPIELGASQPHREPGPPILRAAARWAGSRSRMAQRAKRMPKNTSRMRFNVAPSFFHTKRLTTRRVNCL